MRRFLPALLCLLLIGCGTRTGGMESMTYTYKGGLVGYDRELSLKRNGSYTLRDRTRTQQGTLNRAKREALKERIQEVAWAALHPEYRNPRLADAVVERVYILIDGKTYHVAVGTGGTPPLELQRLLAELQSLFDP